MPFQASKAVKHPAFVEVPGRVFSQDIRLTGLSMEGLLELCRGGHIASIGGGVADCASAAPDCYCLGRRTGIPQAHRTFPLTSPAL